MSQHQHEDQDNVPFVDMEVPRPDCPTIDLYPPARNSMNDMESPLLTLRSLDPFPTDGRHTAGTTRVEAGIQVEDQTDNLLVQEDKPTAKKRETKRPEIWSYKTLSMVHQSRIRKLSAHLGNDNRQPVMVKQVVGQVLAEETASIKAKHHRHGGDG